MLDASHPSKLDLLATEYVNLLRTGSPLSVKEFAAQHPENSEAITQLFPAIASIEGLRNAKKPEPPSLNGKNFDSKVLGDFRIVKEIGRGGMGIVFLAEQISLGREIALKVLPPSFVSEPKYSRRFQREARIAANLHHTHIVPVFGVGQEQDTLYIAMQYIRGVGLNQLIDVCRTRFPEDHSPKRFNIESVMEQLVETGSSPDGTEPVGRSSCFDADLSRSVAQVGLQAANALQYAHEQGVLHRDVTPSNLILDEHGKVWVADFGLASAINHENITETGAVMGTIKYMAPEQYCHDGDARSDVYSLGLTLFELATLQPARNAKEFFKCIAENRAPQSLPSLRQLNPAIDRDLESIITRAIQATPSERYQTAREMAVDFECFLKGEPLKTRRPSLAERSLRWTRRNPFAASTSAIAIFLMVLVTAISTWGYLRELNHRAQNEAITQIATDALDEIYAQLAPRNLPQDLPAIRSGQSPISSFDVVQMPSDETFAVLEKLQSHYARVSEFSYDPTIKLRAADAKNRIGQINIYLGKLAAAEHAFLDASKMCQEILDSSQNGNATIHAEAAVLMASIWNQLGYVYRGQFNDTLATEAHDKAFEFLERPGDLLKSQTTYRFELARTLYSQDIFVRPDDIDFHQPSRTQRAIKILESLELLNSEDSEIQLLLARCYRRLSEHLSILPNRNDQESIRIMRKLVNRFPNIPQYRFELGYSLTGNYFRKIQNPKLYFERLEETLVIAEDLIESSPNVPRYMQLAVLANEKHAAYCRANDRPADAVRYTETAIGLQKSLLRRFPQLVAQHRVFLYALRLEGTNLMIEQDQIEQAQRELMDITLSVEKLVLTPGLARDWHALRVLTASFDSLARISDHLRQPMLAATARKKADRYRERLIKISS